MEQRKQVIRHFVSEGLTVRNACSIAGISKSSYYFVPSGRAKGKQPSTQTRLSDSSQVSEDAVVNEIKDILSPEFHCYGYSTATIELRKRGYIINKKKVYRIMKDHGLLLPRLKPGAWYDRLRVEDTVPPLESPFATMEVDLMHVHIHGISRQALLASFLCTFCRMVPVWVLDTSIKAVRIAQMVEKLLDHPEVKRYIDTKGIKFRIRSDNGPQFIAKHLGQVLDPLQIEHEFIRPATPQQNGHIESFHSTVRKLVCRRFIFSDINHANQVFTEFFHAYSNTRSMPVLLYQSLAEFLRQWDLGNIQIMPNRKGKDVFCFREKPSYLRPGLSQEAFLG